jgi:lysophospholipase L1-like esterase
MVRTGRGAQSKFINSKISSHEEPHLLHCSKERTMVVRKYGLKLLIILGVLSVVLAAAADTHARGTSLKNELLKGSIWFSLAGGSASPGPEIDNLLLAASSPGNYTTDDLICTYDLTGTSTTSAIAWYKDGSPHKALYMPFEGGVVNALLDYSGHGHAAADSGSPVWNSTGGNDGFGHYTFNGSTDFLVLPHSPLLEFDYITMAAWIYVDTYQNDQRIMSKEFAAADPYSIYTLMLSGTAEKKLTMRLGLVDQTPREEIFSLSDVPLSEWVHVACTFDGTEGVVYINGAADNSGPIIGALRKNDRPLYIGASQFYGRYFDGSIDDVRIYDYALTPEQIATLYNGGIDTLRYTETTDGEDWQTHVTPFSATEAGSTYVSNTITIGIGMVPPTIVSLPETTATEGQLYVHDVDAIGSPVPTYALTTYPAGMTINTISGLIEWTPAAPGTVQVTVEANNAYGTDSLSYSIIVDPIPPVPVIITIPDTLARAGVLYTYDVDAIGNPVPTYELLTFPAGMTIDTTSGLIEWLPVTSGNASVTVEAHNINGADQQSFTIAVQESLDVTRIMPLGNSITYDNHSGDVRPASERISYRYPLWQLLTNAGYSFDFVGSVTAGETFFPDPQNQGHPGWRDDQIADSVYYFLQNHPADIILLHIGTNGLNTSAADVEDILDEIDRFEADSSMAITVLLARIINWAPWNPTVTAFNDNVEAMALARTGDDIVMVDLEDGVGIVYQIQPAGDMWDKLHPNDDGYAKMANGWFAALQGLLPPPNPPVCPDGMTHYWKMDEATGSPYMDFHGVNDAVATNEPVLSSGVVAGAQEFNGVDDEVTVTDDNSFDWAADSSFTIEFWMRKDTPCTGSSIPDNDVIVGRDDASSNLHWWVGISCANVPSGVACFQLRDTNGNGDAVYSNTLITDGEWHHIVAVRDGPADMNRIYVDGIKEDSLSFDYTAGFGGTVDMDIGYLNLPTYYHYEGSVDEIATYDKALSDNEILSHYLGGLAGDSYCQIVTTPTTPVITSVPDTEATVLQLYSYDVDAFGYPWPVYELLSSPAGMTIDSLTGVINWTPAAAGTVQVTVEASNTEGSDSQSFFIYVREPPVCPAGMVSYWKLDETGGTTYDDYYNGRDGQASASAPTPEANGRVGGCQDFNGTSDRITVADDLAFDWGATSSFTVEVWAKFTNVASRNKVMVGRDQSGGSPHWWLGAWQTSGIATFNLLDVNTNGVALYGAIALNDDQWHHLVAVRDESADMNRLYVDGIKVDSMSHNYTAGFEAGTSIGIGYMAYNGTPDYFYDGLLDEIAFYDLALSDAEIATHYSRGTSGEGYCSVDSIAPAIISTPVTSAMVGQPYVYDVNASGIPVPTYELIVSPAGMTIDSLSGVIDWTPAAAGSSDVTVVAFNVMGADSQSFTIVSEHAPVCPADMTHYWTFDETSGDPYEDVFAGNDATCTTCPVAATGIVGGAQQFDGSDDEVNAPDDGSLDWGANDSFSIAYWVKTSASTSGNRVIAARDDAGTSLHWWIGFDDTGRERFQLRDVNGNGVYIGNQGSVLNDGAWHFVVGVRDNSVNMNRIYVDGAKVDSAFHDYTAGFGSSVPLDIGHINLSGRYRYDGILDELATFDKALTDSEIAAFYSNGLLGDGYCVMDSVPPAITSTPDTTAIRDQLYSYDVNATGYPTPKFSLTTFPAGMTIDSLSGVIQWTPAATGTVQVTVEAANSEGTDSQSYAIVTTSGLSCPADMISYWKLDETSGTEYSDSYDGNTGQASVSAPSPSLEGIVNGSQDFNGTSDRITVNDDPSLDWAYNSSFTIEVWAKFTNAASRNKVMIGRDQSGGNPHWWLGAYEATGVATFYLLDTGAGGVGLFGSTGINDNAWHHLVAVRDESVNRNRLYVDGVKVDSATHDYAAGFGASTTLGIGYMAYNGTPDYFYDGLLDEIALYNRALTDAEIQDHHTDGLAGQSYCVPDSAAPVITTTPDTTAVVGLPYTYDVNATGSPAPTYSLTVSPAGMSIDSLSGVIQWTPAGAGAESVTVEAINAKGTDSQNFTIHITDPSPVVRIMPLGNSITRGFWGSPANHGYRRSLYQQLTAAGYTADFVGGETDGDSTDFDRNHEGHDGWRDDQIASSVYGFLQANPADIILLHIGTNAVAPGSGDVRDILDAIDQYEADSTVAITVFLARIINRMPYDSTTTTFNNNVEAMALARTGDDIIMVDMEDGAGFLYTSADMDDSVHPNDTGYGKMADKWFSMLDAYLSGIEIRNLALTATSPGNLTSDDLICTYDLFGQAATSATAWQLDGSALMTLYLPMEGGAANALEDYSGNGITATTYGDPTWNAAAGHDSMGAFLFDGDDDLSAGENFPLSSSYTKTAWVYRTGSGLNGGNNIISGDENNVGHALWAPDTYSNHLSGGHNGNWNTVQDAVPLALDTWFFVALSYDYSNGLMTLYKNGAMVDSATVPPGDRDVTDQTISIGSFGSGNGWMWQGTIDDARIYNRVLSPEQILSQYQDGSNTIKSTETDVGDVWQAFVTPFSIAEAGSTYASNTLTVLGDSIPPAITTTPDTTATVGELYSYDVDATGFPVPTYDLTLQPAGMVIDSTSGLIEWTPSAAGTVQVTVEASNSEGTDSQNYSIVVMEAAVCPSGMVSYWKLDETGGTTYYDSFDGNDGNASTPAPTPAAGLVGGAQDFNGSSNYFTVNDDPSIDWAYNASFTIEVWAKFTNVSGQNKVMIGRDDGGGGRPHWWLGAQSGTGYALFNLIDTNGNGPFVIGSTSLNNDAWHHIVAVRDESADMNRLYVDGAKVDSASHNYTAGFDASTTMGIGYMAYNLSPQYYYDGLLDEIAIYDRALSDAEILQHHTNGLAGSGYCEPDVSVPVITSTPDTSAVVGQAYIYDVDATGYPAPEYNLLVSPAAMTIDSITGMINWLPDSADVFAVMVEAYNSEGADSQSYNIHVVEPVVPEIENLVLASSSGGDLTTDSLLCTYDLIGSATTAATAWYKDSSPLLTMYLPMEGGAVSALADYSGNGNDGTGNTGAAWDSSAGHDGRGAFVFDGTNSAEISIGNIMPTGSYTKTAWVNAAAGGSRNIISGNQRHAFWISSDTLASGHNEGWTTRVMDSEALALDTWFFVAVTFDPAVNSGEMILYKNGAVVDSATGVPTQNPDDPMIWVGAFNDANTWQGVIDDARLYDYALSRDQIQILYTLGISTIAPSETDVGEQWQAQVTPFSGTEAGSTYVSNTITILPDSIAPIITSLPETTGTVGWLYSYDVEATGYPLPTYELTLYPAGMSIDSISGLIEWTPAAAGSAQVIVEAANAKGTDNQNFWIVVAEAPSCPADMTHYWKLDETTGAPYADFFAGNDATCTNCPAASAGIVGNGQFFDGVNDEVTAADDDSWDWGPDASFSIAYWMLTNASTSGNRVLVGRDDTVNSLHWWIGCDDSGKERFQLQDINGNGAYIGDKGYVLNDSAWHFVVAVRDNGADMNRIYVDGVKIDSAFYDYTAGFAGTAPLDIGYLNLAGHYRYEGIIDEVTTFDRALHDAEIMAHYNNGLAGNGYCDLDSIAPVITSAPDTSGMKGQLYTYDVDATGYPEPKFELLVSPAAMTIDSVTGVIDWTPTSGGVYPVQVRAHNSAGADSQSFDIHVIEVPEIENLSLTSTSGNDYTSDDLTCSYDLAGSATTAATAWYIDGSPLMALYFPMEGDEPGALKDYSGNGHDGTKNTGVTWDSTAGHDGRGAYVFDGSGNAEISVGNFMPTAAYTKAAWVKMEVNGDRNIISGNQRHTFWISDGYLAVGHNNGWDIRVTDSDTLVFDTWFFVAVTFDPAVNSGEMILYKNGAVVDSAASVPTQNPDDPMIWIGAFSGGTNWQGVIDDPRVYDYALTRDQIIALYSVGTDVIKSSETDVGDEWQARVTPFSSTEAGSTYVSNTITILVEPVAPVITSLPETTGTTGLLYAYDVDATGIPVPEYELLISPSTMTVDSLTGVISWMPDSADVYPVQVRAYNSAGADSQSFDIDVTDPIVPELENMSLTSTSGKDITSDDLSCSYDLTGSATTASSAWYVDGSPILSLYLPMEGGATEALNDYSGNGITAVPNGDPAWGAAAGYDGYGAFVFDGNDDLSGGENFPTLSSYTKTAWVYRTGSGSDGGNNIISGDENTGGHAFWAPDTYGNKLSGGNNFVWNIVQDSVALDLSAWTFVALSFDRASGMMKLYKDSLMVDSATVAPIDRDVTDATISIGSFGYSNGWMWLGTIDDARIYNRALTAEQLLALYELGGDVIKSSETNVGEDWLAKVTPFSSAEAGATYDSDTLTINEEFALTINIVGNGSVVKSPDQSGYVLGDSVILTAVPDSAWSFVEWSDDLTGEENPDTLVITGSMTVTATFSDLTSVNEPLIPRRTALYQNYPNPFNPMTKIRFDLGGYAHVQLSIYDIAGRRVRTLVNRHMPAGIYTEIWDGRDAKGETIASGVYFYRLKAGKKVFTRKAVFLK